MLPSASCRARSPLRYSLAPGAALKGSGTNRTVGRDRRRTVQTVARRLCGSGAIGSVAWRGVLTRFRTPRTALETFTGAGVGLARRSATIAFGPFLVAGAAVALVGFEVGLDSLLIGTGT